MTTYPTYSGEIPYLTTEQMVEVDRAMIEDYGISLVQMMENAGRNLAHLARDRFLGGDPRGKRVVILAGSGGNGGGALVAARRLSNYGAHVHVYLTKGGDEFKAVPAQQLAILHRMGVSVATAESITAVQPPDLILDGVIGYSLKGAPYGTAATLIHWANKQDTPTLALDTPSGLDTASGTVFDPAIRAAATITLALPKEGLRAPAAADRVGDLYLADISAPPSLYAIPTLGLTVGPIFALGDVVRLW
jgi:NAD(P)H-hydrate epimerase